MVSYFCSCDSFYFWAYLFNLDITFKICKWPLKLCKNSLRKPQRITWQGYFTRARKRPTNLYVRSLGTTPISGKTLSEPKRPFSELWESSGVFSEQLSEFKIPFSEYEIPFSEWHPTTWAIRKPQFSEQLPERFPELMGTHKKKIFICPSILGAFFLRIGVVPARQNTGDPRRAPEKQTVGIATASNKMLALQALWDSSSLNDGHLKEGLPGPRRGFWVLECSLAVQSVPQKGRVHLHIIEKKEPWQPIPP